MKHSQTTNTLKYRFEKLESVWHGLLMIYGLGALQTQESAEVLYCRPLVKLPKLYEIIPFIDKCLGTIVINSPWLYFFIFYSFFKFASYILRSAKTALINISMISKWPNPVVISQSSFWLTPLHYLTLLTALSFFDLRERIFNCLLRLFFPFLFLIWSTFFLGPFLTLQILPWYDSWLSNLSLLSQLFSHTPNSCSQLSFGHLQPTLPHSQTALHLIVFKLLQ